MGRTSFFEIKGPPTRTESEDQADIVLKACKQIVEIFWVLGNIREEFVSRVQNSNQSFLSNDEYNDLVEAKDLIEEQLGSAKVNFTDAQYGQFKELISNWKINKLKFYEKYEKIISLKIGDKSVFIRNINKFKKFTNNFNNALNNNSDENYERYAALRKPKIYGSKMMIQLRRLLQTICNWFNHEWKVSTLSKIDGVAKIANYMNYSFK